MSKLLQCLLLLTVSLMTINDAGASTEEPAYNALYNNCVLESVANSADDITVEDVRNACRRHLTERADIEILYNRRVSELLAGKNRRSLTPHQRNYLLPLTASRLPDEVPLPPGLEALYPDEDLDNLEAKFQISLKFLAKSDLLLPDDRLHFGFTTMSFWQAYNKDVSAPFRETNYEPEVFWHAPVDWRPWGVDAALIGLGFSHQSNGRSGTFSRSWNRVYANLTLERGNFVFDFKPWYRIREDDKQSPLDPNGDDNPDIEHYLGHFEFTTTYRRSDYEVSVMFRNNLRSDNVGAIQLDWTFPIWRGLKGYVQYFNGYGENLIDYNQKVERIGFGLLLSDLF